MNTVESLVSKFGSQSALARLLGKRPSTVQYWAKSGVIPAKWHARILEAAQQAGVIVSPEELAATASPGHPDVLIETPNSVVLVEAKAKIPEAKWLGDLMVGDYQLPCYVLDDGRRVISRGGATRVLTDSKGGGNLEQYVTVESLREYVPTDLDERMIEFNIPSVVNRTVKGVEAETFLEICQAYVRALNEGALKTDRQKDIAMKAGMFLAGCAKVGLIALIDEATGYQYERTQDALQFKLRVYLEEEMRKWEKTFPDELWREFARLTRWKSESVTQRPKYWGKLVMELVYDYLDEDVSTWLKENAPSPRHGQNYHQWLSSQYGLKKLTEHLWMLIGMASACHNMRELRDKMAERFGRYPVQMTFYFPPETEPVPSSRRLNEPGESAPIPPRKTPKSSAN